MIEGKHTGSITEAKWLSEAPTGLIPLDEAVNMHKPPL